jgi:hypothetical protein
VKDSPADLIRPFFGQAAWGPVIACVGPSVLGGKYFMWKQINHELMWGTVTAAVIVKGACLWVTYMPLQHNLALAIYASWLLTGAQVLRQQLGYPNVIPSGFPKHPVPLALTAFATMIVWPLVTVRGALQRR